LRKSGISQDVATAKLAKYKAQLEQVQIQEQKRREQHLTRALAPQATDVVVSLWSGQNPLTVLLQQGGQRFFNGFESQREGKVPHLSTS
jgi:phage-related minor tail protein